MNIYSVSGKVEASSIMPAVASPSATPVASSSSGQSDSVAGVIPQAIMIIFSMVLLIVVLGVLLICFLKLRKDKKKRRAKAAVAAEEQPCFQPSAELDAGQERHEMEAECRRYEMEGRDRCHKMVGKGTRLTIPSLGMLHELWGEEHARELDGSHSQ